MKKIYRNSKWVNDIGIETSTPKKYDDIEVHLNKFKKCVFGSRFKLLNWLFYNNTFRNVTITGKGTFVMHCNLNVTGNFKILKDAEVTGKGMFTLCGNGSWTSQPLTLMQRLTAFKKKAWWI